MVLNDIEKLIEKYENGETTLKEEEQLKDYFSQETVDPHLEVYKPMFQYFLVTKKEQFTKDVPLKTKNTYALYRWISVAAVAVLMFGLYFQNTRPSDEIDPVLAQQTMEALNLLSTNFNKGTSSVNLLSTNFNKGAENIAYVGTFGETTNKIFKNN
ncbi:MAG: hypothetical protein HKO81_10040 [Flavobacteriaceae bacterium]|nr:hypothetical protein [Bacteroidia bacterium]NNL16966.1 hypothetical protein [Flavobacteriaceae bacterium]